MDSFTKFWFEKGHQRGVKESKLELVDPDNYDPELMWKYYPRYLIIIEEIKVSVEKVFKCEQKPFFEEVSCRNKRNQFQRIAKVSWVEGYAKGVLDVFGFYGREEE